MTAPDEIQAALKYIQDWTPDMVRDYVTSLQSALADRDATISRLQAELIAKDDAWIADQTNNANEIIRLGDKLERLQARLDAGPTVEQLRKHVKSVSASSDLAIYVWGVIIRMAAANAE